jgi:acetyl esterase/lipase
MVVDGLNRKGFCVASIDYRLYKKGGSITIKDCVTDCKDAVRFLAKNSDEFGIDPRRVFTFGDSAGGQLAQMLLLTEPALLPGDEALAGQEYQMVAGVSWYGPCDFERTELFNHDGRADFRDRFGPRILPPNTDPDDNLRLYREMSPVNYLTPDSSPLLMIQGDGDTTIPVHHARYMQERAEKIGAPVEILIVENAGHNWRMANGKTPIKPARETIIARTVAFLTSHLSE